MPRTTTTPALEDYDKAIDLFPGFADAHIERGILLHNEGHDGKALDEAVKDAPDAYAPSPTRCQIRLAARTNLKGALGDCTVAIRAKPREAAPLQSCGLVHLALGQCAAAKADFEAAVALDPAIAKSLPSASDCTPTPSSTRPS